ncbi:MAG: hypothetical protein WD042_09420 [Phycisphaeraceae bacterium]
MKHWLLATGVLFCMAVASAWGQLETVTLRIDKPDVGLAGYYRPGTWTPMRVTVENKAASARRAIIEWNYNDSDGDQVQARRLVTLSPQSVQSLWLYGMPSLSQGSNISWSVRAISVGADATVDSQSGEVRDRLRVMSDQRVPDLNHVVGIIGSSSMGLLPYQTQLTHHSGTQLIRGLQADRLPDRWYGLSLLDALIWTPEGGDPGSPAIPPATRQAIREWVRRGGHLIIVMPSEGDFWTASPLRDMLPVTGEQIRRIDDLPAAGLPLWLGSPNPGSKDTFSPRWFDIAAGTAANAREPSTRVAVLLADRQLRPMVIAGQYGFGRVTMIGFDITDAKLLRMGFPLPLTMSPDPVGATLWATVFGWRGPVLRDEMMQQELADNTIAKLEYRPLISLDRAWLPSAIAMTRAFGPSLGLAILVFLVYWAAAGASFFVLRGRGQVRYAWMGFLAVVLVFTAVSWAGALALRPATAQIAHFSILDYDMGSGLVRAQSWLAAFVPKHGRVEVELDPAYALAGKDTFNTLASPGVDPHSDQGEFIDPQTYTVDAASPQSVVAPYRSTAKMFAADYLFAPRGIAPSSASEAVSKWPAPVGNVRMSSIGQPVGQITHHFPVPLRDVLVVYSPGDGAPALVMRPRFANAAGAQPGEWAPGTPLSLVFDVRGATRLVIPPMNHVSAKAGERAWDGHLGRTLKGRPLQGILSDQQTALGTDTSIQLLEMMTFYSTLPPPDFRETSPGSTAAHYQRSLTRQLDLTHLLALQRIIILGHAEDRSDDAGPLPLPLTLDGQEISARGWTFVRLIYPVEEK